MARAKKTFERLRHLLSRPALAFYSLAWLMVVLVIGTIAQKDLGLYVAQNRFFSSYFFWAGGIPLPGGYPVMALIFVGVVARLSYANIWTRQKLGVNLVHLGVVLLLGGGFLTALFSFEGNMVIPEGGAANFISDYHRTELAFTDSRPVDHDQVTAIGQKNFRAGEKISVPTLPFGVEILRHFKNAEARPRTEPAPADARGFAKNFELVERPQVPESERNRAGIMFRVEGGASAGYYILLERMPVAQTLVVEGGSLTVDLRRVRTQLPFQLELKNFEKKLHPGTEVAEAYRSDLVLRDGNINQPVRVEMNEPLRYKGYTFYQASFIEDAGSQTTVLAVVHNVGRLFPYISSIIMCLGLLLHLMMHLPRLLGAGRGTT